MLAYLTFGDQIQTVVIVNLDPRNKMVQVVSTQIEYRVFVWRLTCAAGTTLILLGDLIVHPSATVPGSQDHGERSVHSEWEAGSVGQVAEERVSFLHRRALHYHQLDWRPRLRQVRGIRRKFRLVGSPHTQPPFTPSDVPRPAFRSASCTHQCCITKHLRAHGKRKLMILP